MAGGLHDTGSNRLSPALCMGRIGHALCCTGSVTTVFGAVKRGLVPAGDTGREVSGAIIPPGRFVKSFLPVSGGS